MFIKFDDVTADRCDIFIQITQLSPDRIGGSVGIEMTFSNDDL